MTNERSLMVITGALFLGGGIAAANRLVLHAFLDAGYAVDVLALNEAADVSSNISPMLLSYRGMGNSKIALIRSTWSAIMHTRYQVIFCDHVNLAAMLAPLSMTGLIRYIVRLNGIEVFPDGLTWEGKLGLHGAHKRTAISDHTRQQVLLTYPRLAVDVCDLALDSVRSQLHSLTEQQETITTLVAMDGSEQQLGKHVILHVGRMSRTEQYKGQDVLIEAMPALLQAVSDVQLVLVGRGDDEERLQRLAAQHPQVIQRAIFMTGFVSDAILDQLYQACYVFAMPSRGEGFGLVYLEAMRYAKPCLGSRVDAARCVIRDGETGLLVDEPTNHQEIAEKLITLLQDPPLAKAMGEAGRELLKREYLFDSFKKRFIDYVRQVC
jgi:phosphatidylinositol alpha-1,6-mannosyltransferase